MRYKHDCEACVPLGEHDYADLYYCDQHGIPTLIARYSDEGYDYISGLEFACFNPDLIVAKRLARKRDLL